MRLFKYEGYKMNISEEAFALKPFRMIWNRDRSASKDKAMMELSYVYFMEDPRSDYQIYVDEDERSKKIIEGEGFKDNWKEDSLILEARKFYAKFKPISALLLEDTRVAVDKLRTKLREIDLDEVDDKGKPIYTLNTVVSTIKQVPSLIKDLDEAERAITTEIAQSDKVRGRQEKAAFEEL